MLISLKLIYYFIKIKNFKNFFTLISGIIIFYPICFVDSPVHAILMGVTIHYSQYLIFSHKVNRGRNIHKKGKNLKNFLTLIIFYSIMMTVFTLSNKMNQQIFSNLIVIPICAQMLHFYIDSYLWKFSVKHNRENVLKHLIS